MTELPLIKYNPRHRYSTKFMQTLDAEVERLMQDPSFIHPCDSFNPHDLYTKILLVNSYRHLINDLHAPLTLSAITEEVTELLDRYELSILLHHAARRGAQQHYRQIAP